MTPYRLTRQPFGSFTQYTLSHTEGAALSVIPEFGANLHAATLCHSGQSVAVIDGDPDAQTLQANQWYKSANLLPFPNRINDGAYLFNGKQYQLPLNFPQQRHAIHGLVYNMPFTLLSSNLQEQFAAVSFKLHFDGQIPGYPFPFEATITYQLTATHSVTCTVRVVNTGLNAMPFAAGWHPYFTFDNNDIADLQLCLPPNLQELLTNERQIPTGAVMPYPHFTTLTPIGNTVLDTCFKLPDAATTPQAETVLYCPQKKLALHVWQQTTKGKYAYIQIFTPPNRKSVAVEPMTAAPNAFNNSMGLLVLAPGKTFVGSYGAILTS